MPVQSSIRSTRQHLFALVLGAMVPFALLAALFVIFVQRNEGREAQARLAESAQLLAEAMDREFDAAAQVLETLSRSGALENGDLAAFHALAVELLPDRFSSIALTDADMNVVLNTRRPFGTELPRSNGEIFYRRALQEDTQVVGGLIKGSVSGTWLFAVARPVGIGGGRTGVLLITMTPDRMQRLLRRLPGRYIGMIMDADGTIVARTLNPEKLLGQQARAEVLHLIAQAPSGFTRLHTVEGIDTFLATYRSPVSGWVALVGEETSTFNDNLLTLVGIVSVVSMILMSAGLLAAHILARRLFLSMEDLSQMAGRLDQEVVPGLRNAPATQEIAATAEALGRSHAIIAARTGELRQARWSAEAAGAARSQFLAHMSHELRTPLTAVIGFAEALRVGIAGPLTSRRQSDYATNIEAAGRHLLSLINDILDIAKIDAGRVELVPADLDLAEVVQSAITLAAGIAATRAVDIDVDVPDPAPFLVADRRAVLQILVNLLSNAAKFSPHGERVRVTALADAGWVEIRVADQGPGMTAEEVALALTPFRQGANAHHSDLRGTGLGLPLAKRLAELHGGSLEIRSAPGQGTTVVVRLPSSRQST